MIFGGMQKVTLLDYPGKVATILFCKGCNLSCRYCYNACLVTNKGENIPFEEILSYLRKRKHLIEGVVLCGGEPTIYDDIDDVCAVLKEMGFSVKLDTNGAFPQTIATLIEKKYVDYIAMDIKGDYRSISSLVSIPDPTPYYQSIDIIRSSPIPYEFRTTLIKGYHSLDDFPRVVSQIEGASLYVLQNFVSANTLDPSFQGKPFMKQELLEFLEIAGRYVKTCMIRE